MTGIGNGLENSFVQTALLPPKPAETGRENRQGSRGGNGSRQGKKEKIAPLEPSRGD
jgi:hypothetical protein